MQPCRRTAKWSFLKEILVWQRVALCLVGFFLGRAMLLGELGPFSPAFAAAALFVYGRWAWVAVGACLLGQATVLHGAALAQAMVITASVGMLLKTVPGDLRNPKLVIASLTLAVDVVIRASFLAFSDALLYDYVAVLFEGVMAGVLTYVFINAFTPKVRSLSGEEFFCLMVLLAGVVAGTGSLAYNGVTLKGILSKFAVLMAAVLGGGGLGAAAGAIVGVIPGVAYAVAPAGVGGYAFAGFLGGVCRRFGKPGVAVGFLLGNIVLAVYINDYASLAGVLSEAAIAIVAFTVIPLKWMENVRGMLPPGTLDAASSGMKIQELVKSRVRSWSKMFAELSRTFAQVSSAGTEVAGDKTVRELFNEIRIRICQDCALQKTCWQREADRTHQTLMYALGTVDQAGAVKPENFPGRWRQRCLRIKELAVAVTCLYETYKVNRYWYRRLLESREVLSEHLRGLSNIMQQMATELASAVERAGKVDVVLRQKLQQLEIPVNHIEAAPREDGKLEITISRPPCRGEMACRYIVAPLVSKTVGQPFTVATTNCTCREQGASECAFKLHPALRYRINIGVAKECKTGNTVSGDTHATLDMREGKFAMLLSDGMGVGPQAALESSTTISLLEHLFESGFGQDMAVKTVNSILMLRAPDESFATVDIAVIDLYGGKTEFVKIGSAPSFIVSGVTVQTVHSSSLPVGIIKDIEVSSVVKGLTAGDIVVMVTDGVLDCYRDEDKEDWLANMLVTLSDLEPREIANAVLQNAKDAAGGILPDDVTVLVGRLEKAE